MKLLLALFVLLVISLLIASQRSAFDEQKNVNIRKENSLVENVDSMQANVIGKRGGGGFGGGGGGGSRGGGFGSGGGAGGGTTPFIGGAGVGAAGHRHHKNHSGAAITRKARDGLRLLFVLIALPLSLVCL